MILSFDTIKDTII